MPSNRGMDNEDMVHIYNGVLLSHKKEQNNAICSTIDGPRGDFPDSSVGKESACNAGCPSSIRGSGRSSGEGKGYPLQYSGLENSWSQRVRHN